MTEYANIKERILASLLATDPSVRSATLLKVAEVARRIGVSRAGIFLLVKRKQFPKPLKLGPRTVRFLDIEVAAWIADRAAERGAQ